MLAPKSNPSPLTCDLLVVGSGVGGLATALSARKRGLDVLLIEKAGLFGGTSCFSAGVIWVPCSRQAQAAGIVDNRATALKYLHAEAGNRLASDRAEVFVAEAADILAWFESNSALKVALAPAWPDYHPEQPGACAGGRSLGPVAFDGRTLGPWFAKLRPPLKTTTILGGMMVGREDLVHFYGMLRSWRSLLRVGGLFARYLRDRLSYPRSTRLSNGAALVAMLARTALEEGVRLEMRTTLLDLVAEDGRIVGARVTSGQSERVIGARAGVVLATGGFPGNAELRARYYRHVGAGMNHHSLAPEGNVGDGMAAAQRAGAALREDQKNPAAWTPVSLVPQADGSTIAFPHFFDRGKAGYVAVDRRGRRFISEARSYHDFVPAMIETCRGDPDVHCHLICDSRAIRRYGLGAAPPSPGRLAPHLRSGYVISADTVTGLADRCGIDPQGLANTLARFNTAADDGRDPEFDKGGDVYQRFNGSAGRAPNPCVAPVRTAPFYAMRLVPGDIGTFIGLRADAGSRVLDSEGRPIPGLFAAGNDVASFMGGAYPAAGITLGPALVFGHIAARTAANDFHASR